ncbi:DEAD/DEAH box helicase [Microbacterium sp. NRRL B-14842]|uniref:DEAD/DEAH box helicase n=1 Tax=Microbacterium sp. NRRL B-14842 TaxID=3162881 RepID=UPI003D2898B4
MEIVSGANVILSTPTGTGKSLVAVGAHFAAMVGGRRSYYTAPIKALVSEKFFALAEVFGAENVGMVTGDSAVNADAPIICCTAEILANLALRQGDAADVGLVVMDEFHFYGDPDRGWAWQVPLLELPQAQFVLMSAPRRRHHPRRRPDASHRTGDRLGHRSGAPGPAALLLRDDAHPRDHRRPAEHGTGPVYIVHFSQAAAMERAQALSSTKVATREQRGRDRRPHRRLPLHDGVGKTLSRFLRAGIGVHHAACCRSTAGSSNSWPSAVSCA